MEHTLVTVAGGPARFVGEDWGGAITVVKQTARHIVVHIASHKYWRDRISGYVPARARFHVLAIVDRPVGLPADTEHKKYFRVVDVVDFPARGAEDGRV
jgi:hypothetical protein